MWRRSGGRLEQTTKPVTAAANPNTDGPYQRECHRSLGRGAVDTNTAPCQACFTELAHRRFTPGLMFLRVNKFRVNHHNLPNHSTPTYTRTSNPTHRNRRPQHSSPMQCVRELPLLQTWSLLQPGQHTTCFVITRGRELSHRSNG